jgi:predicted anti-sigma-YlaC factor YlaD
MKIYSSQYKMNSCSLPVHLAAAVWLLSAACPRAAEGMIPVKGAMVRQTGTIFKINNPNRRTILWKQ